ncbi:MAG: helix-turn-helix domain-containing protein [Actinomycetota bacterium]|nr:helix-turn-helix domain-containing protein [Actinomycetota bacterium]
MSIEFDLATVGALVGDRVRAAILLRLLGGTGLSASELAAAADASPSLTSGHLKKLLAGGLVAVEPDGRRRVYRLASVEVAEMLEAMQHLAPEAPVTSLRDANSKRRLRRARLCYDHVAGVLGTAVTDALVRHDVLRSDSDVLVLGDRSAEVLGQVGIDLDPLRAASRPVLRQCTDWTERRPHVAGGLGAAIAERMLDQRWVLRRPGSRGLDVTVDGAAGLEQWLGLRVPAWGAWLESAS